MANTPAPLGGRCVAFIVDDFLNFLPCYFCWKDGIRDGQSFGKGLMGLRVIKVSTGAPATVMDSCLRNCCNLCVCVLFIQSERRHVGDLIAGTMVIEDK
ncbi:MAG: RDD family protein [Candidatus Hodarchaeales archaeon]|jgi:uncharacterized RDD family membrane protein YckC